MRFPSYSGSLLFFSATESAAPELMPISNPSRLAASRATRPASAAETGTTSSMIALSSTFGTKPAPIP